jgi:hypothetical protein
MPVARLCLAAIAVVAALASSSGSALSRGFSFGTSRPYAVISGPITKSSPAATVTDTQPTIRKPKAKHRKASPAH